MTSKHDYARRRDYRAAQQELVAEYLDGHPDADEADAYAATEYLVHARMEANYWCRVDEGRQRAKDGDLDGL